MAGVRKRTVFAAGAAALAAAVSLSVSTPAAADTAPVSPTTPRTVSADLLPAPQINGVVWAQVVAGNRVYATGQFTTARPFGAAPGTSQVTRSNILAYDVTTGALVNTWAPSLNAQGLGIAASPDGTRIYVVGDFTQVNGATRNRIVALDATTGGLVSGFVPNLNYKARAVAATADTVYVGGGFTTANGTAKQRVAAFAASNGTLRPFNASVDAEIQAITVVPALNKVVLGGRFTVLSGVANYGMGAVDGTTGTALPWPVNQIIRNAGSNAAINSLSNDGVRVYGTGYWFGAGGNFEGTFGADAGTGQLSWVNGCRGDTYSAVPIGPVLYSVSHAHDCGMVQGNPQTTPTWSYQRAMASTTAPAADGRVNTYSNFVGRRAAEILHWLPTIDAGSYTGQTQGAWSTAGTSQYLVLGGEFPRINGIAQQGLARFAVREIAPNLSGPMGYDTLKPTLTGVSRGTVRATWTAAWDRDNRRLTYELLRGTQLSTATVVGTVSADSNWWTRPTLAITDSTAPPGTSQTYRIRVRDALNNTVISTTTAITVPT
jgi:hypothetical protein